MLPKHPRIERLFVLLAAVLAMFVIAAQAAAQSPASNKLAMLRTQNAYQQQQAALQLAIQQTNLVTQRATRQDTATEPVGFFEPLNFGPQQAALQFAFQQSTMVQPIPPTAQPASPTVRGTQSNIYISSTIQSVMQTSAILQNTIQLQGGQLTSDQIQTLFNEQAALVNLLAIPRK